MKDFPRINTAKDALEAFEAGARANRFLNTAIFNAVAEACIGGTMITRVVMPGVAEPQPGKTVRLCNRELVEALLPTWQALAVQRMNELGYYVEGQVIRASTASDPGVLWKMTVGFGAAKDVDEQFIPAEIVLPNAVAASRYSGASTREVGKVQRYIAMFARGGQRSTDYQLSGGEVLLRDNITVLLHQLGYEVTHPADMPYGSLRIRWAPAELAV